ncbi:MAG TPA: hypothetical protein VIY51_20730 [Xanthobacteraceae bacterium]
MPSMPTILTANGSAATSRVFQPDVFNMTSPFNISVETVMNSTAAAPAYNIEVSNDPANPAPAITWFSSLLTAAASSSFLQITVPCRLLRLNVTSNSSQGSVTSTVLQSG